MTWISARGMWPDQAQAEGPGHCSCLPTVPELAARGIIQQVFPVHEQRILNRLMKSWVQAVCENQPLGAAWARGCAGVPEGKQG